MDEIKTGNKEQLFADLYPQAKTEAEQKAVRAFMDRITEKQAAQLVELYDFTEPFQIPVWDDETGGPARDANRQHDTPPDRIIQGITAPRNVADDLAIIIFMEGSLEGVQQQIELTAQLSEINKEYWRRLGKILGKPKKHLISAGGKRINSVDYPVDKLDVTIWGLLEKDTKGQIKVKVESSKSKKPVSILYAINFDDLGVTTSKKLTYFDKRVYTIIAALYKAGNRLITCSQIHQAMGYITRPAATQIEKIRNSIIKMSSAKIFIDNADEVANGYKYPHVVVDGPLLPIFHRHDCIINGQPVQEAFAPICIPPLIEFARGRNQIDEISKKVLETPISKSEKNMAIEDYLITRILHARNDYQGRKILLSTLFEYVKIDDSRNQKRALKDIKGIMEHYQSIDFISSFKITAEAITFSCEDKMSLVQN